ncbi:STM4015 family protein [Nonomuraea sp. NPDC046802]|uniref:STM4015 family protein n=1 Tax=Nonomuraea sp. NPDC046802 TaxID=3154919 RepID=UPI0034037A0A
MSTIDYRDQPSHYERYDEEYAGLPVTTVPWSEEDGPQPEAGSVAWRLHATEWDDDVPSDDIREVLDWFFDHVDTTKVTAIVVGNWECTDIDSEIVVQRLSAEAARLPALRSLFFGAIPPEEAEISWIEQSDITPLLEAFPKLEHLEVRGGTGLALQPVRHESLRTLRIETGGLPGAVVRGVAAGDLPALEFLEFWFGIAEYGGDTTTADLAPIMTGERLPALRHLRLQNAEFQDDIAAAIAGAPVVARLESLNLSMGSLTDAGAESLLSGQPLTHLRRLDLSHHYLSDAMMTRLTEALPDMELVLANQRKTDDDWRYVAVSE